MSELLQKENIVSVVDLAANVTVIQNRAANFSADAVLSFLNEGNDKSVYLYGGTRLKTAVAKAINGKDIAVTKANNVYYNGIISAILPSINSKLTSVILSGIINKYRFTLTVAEDNKLKTLVLSVPTVSDAIISNRIATAVVNEIKMHPYYNSVKIVLTVSDAQSYGIYKKAIGDKV